MIDQPTGKSTSMRKSPAWTRRPTSDREKTTTVALSIELFDTLNLVPFSGTGCDGTGTVRPTMQLNPPPHT